MFEHFRPRHMARLHYEHVAWQALQGPVRNEPLLRELAAEVQIARVGFSRPVSGFSWRKWLHWCRW